MDIKNITGKSLAKTIENAAEVRRNKKYLPYEQIEKYMPLEISRAGFYGRDKGANIEFLGKHNTSFNSLEDIQLRIEGVVVLDSVPVNNGIGGIAYNGYGVLEVNNSVIYDGRGLTHKQDKSFKVTYYELININSGTSGSLQDTPEWAIIQENQFGDSGNAVLSTITGANTPTMETPINGGAVTVSLDTSGNWVSNTTYLDPVALIYSFVIPLDKWTSVNQNNLIDYFELQNASSVDYQNDVSGLIATNVKDAIDEVRLYFLDNEIPVNQANVSTTLGGVIDSTKKYVIDGKINMGSIQVTVPPEGITIGGLSFDVSGLYSNEDNYTMFVSESAIIGSGNVLGMDYYVEVTGTGSKVYELYDATGFNAFEFQRINYIDCTSLGDIYDYRQGLETGTGRFGGSPSLTLHGLWRGGFRITTSIVRGLAGTMTEPLFKEGVLFQMNSRFLTDINVDLPTLAPLCDFKPINFPNTSTIQFKGCEVTRDGVYSSTDTNLLPNLSEGDLPCYWKNNNGLPNTFIGGTSLCLIEGQTTINTVGVYEDVQGTWGASQLQHFSVEPEGKLKYLGNTLREFEVSLNINIDGGSNDDLAIKFFKFDDSLGSEIPLDYTIQKRPVNNFSGGRDVAFFVNFLGVTLDKNDLLYIKVANLTDTSNVTFESGSFFRLQER